MLPPLNDTNHILLARSCHMAILNFKWGQKYNLLLSLRMSVIRGHIYQTLPATETSKIFKGIRLPRSLEDLTNSYQLAKERRVRGKGEVFLVK